MTDARSPSLPGARRRAAIRIRHAVWGLAAVLTTACCTGAPVHSPGAGAPAGPPSLAPPSVPSSFPWHTGIVATTFWVGEIFDPNAEDGSQVESAYDDRWLDHYGGCDGVVTAETCDTEPRTAANGFFPTRMTPRENPFYLDLPFDDVGDEVAHRQRAAVVPWASDDRYSARVSDPGFSLLKNRWVRIRHAGKVCYGQIQDAGPGRYDDAKYVFGTDDARPANDRFNGAGTDVSPALNGCLGFAELNGENDRVDWQFVDDSEVPPGPWKIIVTTRGVTHES
ncbi:hypothetical protein AB0F91_34155 [Amycolatopsis sp. NPDC023774]|uniref:hypothetical protein n=1 Tax=Amycolatopsis sp. NPDC023774 TaxID=3155015 RepID=UPI0033F5C741